MISSDGWNMLRIFLLGLTVAVMSLPASAENKPGFNPHEGLFTSNEGMELKADVTQKWRSICRISVYKRPNGR
jgi:uncharacterized paraquat-inducible protein A